MSRKQWVINKWKGNSLRKSKSRMSLHIKKLRKEDINNLKQLFEGTPILSEYNPFVGGSDHEFKWQFFCNEYNRPFIILPMMTNELIGTLAALIIPMQAPDGNVYYTIKPEDALINIRGLIKHNIRDILNDLFTQIVEETKLKDIKFSWGFTEAVDAFERLGFENCFTSQQGVYTLKPILAYKYLVNLNASQ